MTIRTNLATIPAPANDDIDPFALAYACASLDNQELDWRYEARKHSAQAGFAHEVMAMTRRINEICGRPTDDAELFNDTWTRLACLSTAMHWRGQRDRMPVECVQLTPNEMLYQGYAR